jgi:nucleoside-diphosphate-sugar epimerase
VAFVAGATGYTGREVVRALVEAQVDTVAHVRPDSARLADWRERFSELGARVDATAWDSEAMAQILAAIRPTLVFALIGTTRARGRNAGPGRAETYETVDIGLTSMLIDAAVASEARPRFVYQSSTGVHADARSRYMATRWQVEERVRHSGLLYVIARPSLITGSDRDEFRTGERVASVVSDAGLAFASALGAKKLRARYRSTTNVALANALVRIATDPDAQSRVYESEELR